MKRTILVLTLTLLLSGVTTVRAFSASEEIVNENNVANNSFGVGSSTTQTPGGNVAAQGAGQIYVILWLLSVGL